MPWQVGRFLATQNSIDVAGRLPIDEVGPIRGQAPGGEIRALEVDCGQLMPRRPVNIRDAPEIEHAIAAFARAPRMAA
jgi:hypothetical protein